MNNFTLWEGQRETLLYCRCHITTYRHLLKANYSRLDNNIRQPSQQDKRVIHDEHPNLKKISPQKITSPKMKEGGKKGHETLISLLGPVEPQPKTPTHLPTTFCFLSSTNSIRSNSPKHTQNLKFRKNSPRYSLSPDTQGIRIYW